MVDLTILMILLTKTTKVKKKIGRGGQFIKASQNWLNKKYPHACRNQEPWEMSEHQSCSCPEAFHWILCSPVLTAWSAEDRSYIPGPAQSECIVGACTCACPVMSDSFVTPWTAPHQAPLSMGFFSSFRESSWPRDQTCVSCIGRRIL